MHYDLTEEEKFYRNALTRMPDGPMALEESYSAVMGIVTEVEQYVKVRCSGCCWSHSECELRALGCVGCSSPGRYLLPQCTERAVGQISGGVHCHVEELYVLVFSDTRTPGI